MFKGPLFERAAGKFRVLIGSYRCRMTREYINKHGKPLAFYSDKHGVFWVNHPNGALTGTIQFGRVLHDIGVDLICANSPQAKGRVERANQTPRDGAETGTGQNGQAGASG